MKSAEKEASRQDLHYDSRHYDSRHYKMFEVDSRLRYFKPHATKIEKTFAEEISYSLGRPEGSRFISPKFFYDGVGSQIFEEICSTPEYYLTRTEAEILKKIGGELSSILVDYPCYSIQDSGTANDQIRLVELGSGSSIKTRIILDALLEMQERVEYSPIDISDILAQSSEQLLAEYPRLAVTGIIDTYEGGMEFLKYSAGRSLIMFLGSSYGNLTPDAGIKFLRNMRSAMKPGDLFLVGLDMVKDAGILESAYDDAAGVTSRFNLNVLARINAELGADFVLENFAHRAVYNRSKQRMEMHLESLCEQTVTIPKSKLVMHLCNGERIHTESSHKYEPEQVQDLLGSAGLEHTRSWTDSCGYFTLALATVC